jgi:hypothetical protein
LLSVTDDPAEARRYPSDLLAVGCPLSHWIVAWFGKELGGSGRGGFGFRACGERLTAEVLDDVLLSAAMDGWRRQIVQHGQQLCGDALDLAWRTRDAVVPVRHTAR